MRIAEYLFLKRRGLSYAQIAEQYGISRGRVFEMVRPFRELLAPNQTVK